MKLARNKRAESAVISNVILAAAVIVVGLTALMYSQYTSANYQQQYSQNINTNIQQMKEKIIFEYVVYDGGVLKAFILNCGTIDNVTINHVIVYTDDSDSPVKTYDQYFGSLDINQRGTIQMSGLPAPLGRYRVEIDTWRGSHFVGYT